MQYEPLRRGFAEFVGTFALIFVGAGSVLVTVQSYGPLLGAPQAIALLPGSFGLVAIALAHGLTIAVMVSALGHISGGHFNPAITLGFVVTRRIAPLLAIVYWLAQFGGAVCGALLLRWFFPENVRNTASLGVPSVGTDLGINNPKAIVLEATLTFFLVWVFFATATDPRGAFKSIAGLAIGLTITIDIFVGGPLTGAAVNPARALGPELVQRAWDDWWVYYAGPFGGAVIAAVAYQWLFLRPGPRPIPVGEPGSGVAEPRPGITAET